jgi:hypothetical protein
MVLHRADPVPTLEDLRERVLGKVLRLRRASCDDRHDPQKAIPLFFEERVERLKVRALRYEGDVRLEVGDISHLEQSTLLKTGTCRLGLPVLAMPRRPDSRES